MGEGRPVRIGVVGLGLIAQAVHLQSLHTLRERLPVTYVCDLSPTLAGQVAHEWGVPRHTTDVEDVLASPDVDAVLLLTPGTHAEHAYRALRAGKHVLAEKPLAHTVRECRELAALADEAGLVLQVGYMKMYDPAVARARAELPGIGVPRVARVTVLHPADEPQAAHQRQLRHPDGDRAAVAAAAAYERARLDEALGGLADPYRTLYDEVLNGSVCHELSLVRAVLGEQPLRWTHAQLGTATAGARLAEPPQLLAVGTFGECQLVLSWNWLPDYPEYEEELAVFGSAGRLRLALPGPYLRDHRAALTVERLHGDERAATTFRADHGTGFTRELEAFHRAVASGAPVLSTAAGAAYDTDALQRLAHVLAGAGS